MASQNCTSRTSSLQIDSVDVPEKNRLNVLQFPYCHVGVALSRRPFAFVCIACSLDSFSRPAFERAYARVRRLLAVAIRVQHESFEGEKAHHHPGMEYPMSAPSPRQADHRCADL